MVDTLAVRYGWTKHYILESLYWEEVWELMQVASNAIAYEKNADMYFQFCLHAQSKDAIKNWKDFPLPFPDEEYEETSKPKPHYGGLDDLPRHIPVKRVDKETLNKLKNGNKN